MVKRKSAAVQTSEEETNNTIPEINVEYLTYEDRDTKHIGNWITADYTYSLRMGICSPTMITEVTVKVISTIE